MSKSRIPLLLLASLVLGPSVAAKTYVVDKNAGPGYHYKSISAAMQVAKAGDIVLVRTASYQGNFSIPQGVRLIGASTPTIYSSIVSITGTAASAPVAMDGFKFTYSRLAISNCKGPVSLDGLGGSTINGSGLGISISNSAYVSISSCTAHTGGRAAIFVSKSRVSVASSTSIGQKATYYKYGSSPGLPGIQLDSGSHVSVVESTIQGGVGSFNSILMFGGTLELGAGTKVPSQRSDAVSGTSGTVKVHSTAVVGSTSSKLTVKKGAFPCATASSTGPGGSFLCRFHDTANQICVPLLGAPMVPTSTPIGTLGVQLPGMIVGQAGKLGSTGSYTLKFTIPNDPSLRGAVVAVQAAILATTKPHGLHLTPSSIVVVN